MDRFTFSCRDLPAKQRQSTIQDVFAPIAQIDVVPHADGFCPEVSAWLLPDVQVGTVSLGGCDIVRGPRHVADGNDHWVFQILVGGSVEVVQKGKRAEPVLCRTGDVYLHPNDVPGYSRCDEGTVYLDVAIPRAALESRIVDVDRVLMRKLAPTPELRLLAGYAEAFANEESAPAHDTACTVATHLQDLAVLALGGRSNDVELAAGRGLRAARLRAVTADIRANLGNSALCLTWLAARHGMSPRYLRALFYREGTSFSDFVLNARLERAHHCLTGPHGHGRTISAIAFETGFGDLSWFNQVFRRRYSMTPSDVRAMATCDTPLQQPGRE